MDRRRFVVTSLAGTAGILAAAGSVRADVPPLKPPSLVFAHLTDMHIKPTGAGPEGLAKCLQHAQAHPSSPAFILNGGDAIMSSLGASEESTRAQWDQYQRIIKAECQLPVLHCIGNHDCWGWQRSKSGTKGTEPLYGKRWAQHELKLEKGYYTHEAGGWRLIVLDSVQERGDGGYKPVIDEEQFAWLEATLRSTPQSQHVLIVSHVPILSVTPLFFYDNIVENYQFRVAGALMHQDVHRLVHLFRGFPNIRACISGHVHLVDDVVFEGKTYLCNGAVSGSWWNGDHKGCPPGYAIMRLWEDGSFQREYVPFLGA
jgi:3',5'-cyclic AMP phosphodiesterase CpdA